MCQSFYLLGTSNITSRTVAFLQETGQKRWAHVFGLPAAPVHSCSYSGPATALACLPGLCQALPLVWRLGRPDRVSGTPRNLAQT